MAERHSDELSNRPAPHRVIDGAELKALRRAAAGIERPQDGIFLAVTADGYAVATGQKGQRIPDSFRRFAEANDLILRAERRLPKGKGEPLDRTGKTRFSVGSDDAEAQRQFAETERAYGGRETYERTRSAGRTKLNYRQWVLVRTPNFKAWFGDWELAALRGFLDGSRYPYWREIRRRSTGVLRDCEHGPPTFSGGRVEWRPARKLAMCCLMSGPCAIRRGTAG